MGLCKNGEVQMLELPKQLHLPPLDENGNKPRVVRCLFGRTDPSDNKTKLELSRMCLEFMDRYRGFELVAELEECVNGKCNKYLVSNNNSSSGGSSSSHSAKSAMSSCRKRISAPKSAVHTKRRKGQTLLTDFWAVRK